MQIASSKRIVVTGLGAVTPVGNSIEECWGNLTAGKSGIGPVTHFDASGYRCQIAGEIKNLDMTKYMSAKELSRLDTNCHFAIAAAEEAMEQAGLLNNENIDLNRCGVLVSSGIGGIDVTCKQGHILDVSGPSRVSPMTVPMLIPDMAAGCLSIRYKFRGPNFGIVSACSTGLHSVGEAAWIIARGDADIMLCGGTEAPIVPLSLAAFGSMRALTGRNDSPETASRPFDATRDGFVPAEGAGILVLESLEHALARGAKPLAEIIGYGATADANHITAPLEDGAGCEAAIKIAMNHAGIAPEEIDYINAHGTSTHLNDVCETRAIKAALGAHAAKVAISSTKSMTGHMLGATGGFEAIVCVKTIQTGVIPPTINLNEPDPECDLDYVPNTARKSDVRVALTTNLGFGGHNAAAIFRRFTA